MVTRRIISNNQFHVKDGSRMCIVLRKRCMFENLLWILSHPFAYPQKQHIFALHIPQLHSPVISWTNYLRYNERENSKCKYFPILKFIVSFRWRHLSGALRRCSRRFMVLVDLLALQPRQPERAFNCFLEFIYNTFSLLECSANLPSQGFDALLGIAELLLLKMLVNLKLRNCSIPRNYLTWDE